MAAGCLFWHAEVMQSVESGLIPEECVRAPFTSHQHSKVVAGFLYQAQHPLFHMTPGFE